VVLVEEDVRWLGIESAMQRLSHEQQRRVEEWLWERVERCGACGNADIRCEEVTREHPGGGLSLHLRCTNSDAEAHALGFGLTWTRSITQEEAQEIGL
jgi:hypothetical protein